MDQAFRRHTRIGRLASLLSASLLAASVVPFAAPAGVLAAAATVTPATGGDAIPATTAKDAPSPAWTSLGGPVITEGNAGQLPNLSTIVLSLPAGFEFNTATGSVAPGGGTCASMGLSALTFPDAQHASVTVDTQSTGACVITYAGLQVRPLLKSLNGQAQRTGSITNTGTTAGIIGVSSYGTLTEVPGTPSQLGFSSQPILGSPGVAFQMQPAVAIEDAVGNRVFTAAATTITLALSANPGGAGTTLICNQLSNQLATTQGLATFGGCRINNAALGYTLAASGGAFTAVQSGLFDVANTVVFTTQPAGAKGGMAFTTQPVIEIRVGGSKAVNTSGATVQLGIYTSSTGTGTLTCLSNSVATVSGVASFASMGCSLDIAGTYTLKATAGSLIGVSSSLVVTAGLATKLTFVTQPAGAAAGQAFTTQPVVAITDAGGNIVTSGVSANVTLTIGANPGIPAGVLTCSPGNTVAVTTSGVNAGKAVFGGCKITNAGVGYTLIATPSSVICATGACATPGVLAGATSTAFTVTAPAADITVTPSASVITWGGTVVISTHFGINGAGKSFTLQGARDGINWATITTLTTNSAGNATLSYRPATNLFYRAVFAGTPDLVAGVSNTARVVVRQIALLRPTHYGATTLIRRGTKVTFTTTVRPIGGTLPAAKVSFFLYKRVGTSWVFVTRRDAYINSLGKASYTFSFGSIGTFYVRSMANPTPFNANSVMSPAEFYRVY